MRYTRREDISGISINAQYNLAKPESLAVKIAGHQRRKMFESFVNCMNIEEADTILDIGVTSDRNYDHSNYLEAWYPHKTRIIAAGIDEASWVESEYRGVRFIKGDGRSLPFANNTSISFTQALLSSTSAAETTRPGFCEKHGVWLAKGFSSPRLIVGTLSNFTRCFLSFKNCIADRWVTASLQMRAN
jgi:hypothetical protein